MAIQDLREILRKPHPATPFIHQGTAINDGVRQLQKLFNMPQWSKATPQVGPRVPETNSNSNSTFISNRTLPTQKVTLGEAHPAPVVEKDEDVPSPRVKTATSPRVPTELRRLANHNNISATATALPPKRTRKPRDLLTYKPKTMYAPGTIIRKRFDDGKWLEGEITGYDHKDKWYRVKYLDGDEEDWDSEEVKANIKSTQRYARSQSQQAKQVKNIRPTPMIPLRKQYDQLFKYGSFPSPKQVA
jgi:hypothetical protein